MEVLAHEPAVIYGKSSTINVIESSFSLRQNSSIFLSKKSSFPDIISEMILKLNRLMMLSKNWDSYNADAPSELAIANALSFLVNNYYLDLPFYFLAPGVNGEVMIEFKAGNLAAELFFLPDGTDEFVLFDDDEVKYEGNLGEDFSSLIQFLNP